MPKRMLLLELNEFNKDLLISMARKYNLRNIKAILDLNKIQTFSTEFAEHHGLDPWVQWVSIHTGVPKSIHGIKRLGDITNLKHLQI